MEGNPSAARRWNRGAAVTRFEYWRLDYGETREDAKQVEAFDAEAAAEKACRLRFSSWDYPSEVEGLCVAEVGSPIVRRFDVTVESVPEFHATDSKPRPR